MTLPSGLNLLLARLSIKDRSALIAQGETVDLVLGEALCDSGLDVKYVYFPMTGFISLVAPIKGHAPLEIGLIGHEGMLGTTLALNINTAPVSSVVQGEGTALRLRASVFRLEMTNRPGLQRIVSRYLYVSIAQQSPIVTCTHFHEVEQRLARWLLMLHDRTPGDQLHLTHSFLADMLGVQRSAITIAAGRFQKKNLISYSRGIINILDRRGLESVSCECYETLSTLYESLFPPD